MKGVIYCIISLTMTTWNYTNNKKVENIKKINYLRRRKRKVYQTDEVLEKQQIKIKESLKK